MDDIQKVTLAVCGWPESELAAAVASPNWDAAGKCHDWRHHVLPQFKDAWLGLSPETRMAIIAHAYDVAAQEEWD